MLPAGWISHKTPGRMRARIPGRRRDEHYFQRVRETLAAEPGIKQVEVNPLTGSVLIHHDLSAQLIAGIAESRGLFRTVQNPDELPLLSMVSMLTGSFHPRQPSPQHERRLALALFALAIHETLRGNITAPAVTLIWYGLRLWKDAAREHAGRAPERNVGGAL